MWLVEKLEFGYWKPLRFKLVTVVYGSEYVKRAEIRIVVSSSSTGDNQFNKNWLILDFSVKGALLSLNYEHTLYESKYIQYNTLYVTIL